jgi:transcription initiation factor TFIID subunit 2
MRNTFEPIFLEWARISKTLAHADKVIRVPLAREAPLPPPIFLSPEPAAMPTPSVGDPVPVPSASSRPSIKLAVGSQDSLEILKPPPKPRSIKKPKIVDAPPPPYIDDGSHDILQEVIAIEREKDEEKLHRRSVSEKEKDKPPEHGTPSKRKKTVSPDEEDEILALATPTKKEKLAVAGPSFPGREPSVAPAPTPTPKPLSGSPNKGKKEKTAAPRPPAEPPKISIKGKEKEVAPPTPKSKNSSIVPINEKKCKDILKILLKLPEASIFARPVDPVIDGCPT